MLKAINRFLKQLSPEQQQQTNPQSVELATAVLLFEIMRADDDFNVAEQLEVRTLLKRHFNLSDDKVEQMVNDAGQQASQATDYHQFTRLIVEPYSIEQRKDIVELLWRVAYADDNLDSHEEHLIRRLSDLLRLRHSEFIQCKLRVLK